MHQVPTLWISIPAQVYERGSNVEQFVTRFLLKESANQIQSLLSSVESAVDAIDEQHSQAGHHAAKGSPRMAEKRYDNAVPDYPPNNRVSVKETARALTTASGAVEVRKEGLEQQINRLAELIGRMENKTSPLRPRTRSREKTDTSLTAPEPIPYADVTRPPSVLDTEHPFPEDRQRPATESDSNVDFSNAL
ncbi:unnamed protein product [Boreogadus saida]